MNAAFLLFLTGLLFTVKAAFVGHNYPRTGLQERTVEEFDEVKPPKTSIKVRELNDEQKQLYFNTDPKMIERTKVLNKVRKLKDQGEEKIKVIYRTRIIGLFDPKMLSDLNTINKILDGLTDSEDFEDSFESGSDDQAKTNNVNKEWKNINQEFDKTTNGEMPANQHSSKKELQNGITVKSVEHDELSKEKMFPLHRVNAVENLTKLQNAPTSTNNDNMKMNIKPPLNTIKNLGDTFEDENETGFKQPVNPFRKVNFVDSLELYRDQQRKSQAAANLKPDNIFPANNQPNIRPIFQRQFSIYRHPSINLNNNIPFIDVDFRKPEGEMVVTNKPILKHPSDTVIYLPAGAGVNANINQNKDLHINPLPSIKLTKIDHTQTEPSASPLQSDWLSNLLMRKVAEAEARAVQAQINEAHHREQQILHPEQQKIHQEQQILHPEQQILHQAQQIVHPEQQILHQAQHLLNPEQQILHREQQNQQELHEPHILV